jgi:phospholipid N-methyltransferase
LLNFCPGCRRDLIERALAVQGPGGRFIQLSYGWWPPIARVAGILPNKMIVWRNLPPAYVWTYKSQSENAPAEARFSPCATTSGYQRKVQF